MSKTLLIALAGIALLSTAALFVFHHKTTGEQVDDETIAQWQSFKLKYNKKYSDPDFEAYRVQVFAQNLKKIKGNKTRGITQFMDLTTEEFKQTYLTLKVKQQSQVQTVHTQGAQKYVDWVAQGKTSRVKDQGQCGSCWSFSTTGSVEAALILGGKATSAVDLSEQELVDCSGSYGNEGCNGGLMDQGFQYIIDKGLSAEADYPYTATDGNCKNTSKFSKVKISKFTDVPQSNCDALKTALAAQPISIAVDAESWQFYTSGVLSDCGNSLDHGVTLVGFVNKSGSDAWKVKNSWGGAWGEQGYIYLADGNTCGLCDNASYPSL